MHEGKLYEILLYIIQPHLLYRMQVIGKFSIRLVPHQKPDEIETHVVNYLTEIHAKRGSPNPIK